MAAFVQVIGRDEDFLNPGDQAIITVPIGGVAQGHMIIGFACQTVDAGAHAAASVADSRGNTYTLGPAQIHNPPGMSNSTQLFYAYAQTALEAGDTITVTWNAPTSHCGAVAFEYSGLSSTSPLYEESGGLGSGSPLDSGPITTTSQEKLLVGFGMIGDSNTMSLHTEPAEWTQRWEPAGDSGLGNLSVWQWASVADRIVNSAGMYNYTSTVEVFTNVFSSNFEGGDFSDWTATEGTPTIVDSATVTPAHGSRCCHFNPGASNENVRRDLPSPVTSGTYFIRLYLRQVSFPATGSRIFMVRSSTAVAGPYVTVNPGGTISVLVGAVNVPSTTVISLNTWYRLDLRLVISDTAGQLQALLYVLHEATLIDNWGVGNFAGGDGIDRDTLPTNIQQFYFGNSGAGATGSEYYLDAIGIHTINWIGPVVGGGLWTAHIAAFNTPSDVSSGGRRRIMRVGG